MANQEDDFKKVISHAKEYGFIFQSSEIYGGINGFWDYGPLGVELKRNVKDAWVRAMVQQRDDVVLIDADPSRVARALELARRTQRTIFQNLFWAFGYNAAAIPLAGLTAYRALATRAAVTTGETVAWIALSRGAGSFSAGKSFDSIVSDRVVSDEGATIPFAQSFSSDPVVVASCTSGHGWDPVAVRLDGVSQSGVDVYLQEEQSADDETSHVNERAAVIAVTPGLHDD